MKLIRGYKFRIYPNEKQRQMIQQTFGCARFVYNHFLVIGRDRWSKGWAQFSCPKQSRMLTELKHKPDFGWLKVPDDEALRRALKSLHLSFQRFYEKRSGFPAFKSKHNHDQAYHTKAVRIVDGHIKLPKIGIVKTKLSRMVEGRIINATVSQTASGKYFVSLCVEMDIDVHPGKGEGKQVGIDMGLKNFYTDDQGNKVASPHISKKTDNKIRRLYKGLARKKMGSRNREKARIRLARMYERLKNIRKDFLHKESTRLVRENRFIAMEDLAIKSMMRNHQLARSISHACWGEFFQMIEYKAIVHGCQVVKVDTFYPSTQLCSCCGYQNPVMRDLKIRDWVCPTCGCHHDRDVNAAKNILQKALEMKKKI